MTDDHPTPEDYFNRAQRAEQECAELRAENARLRAKLALADELLMEAWGAYPLPGNPNREKMGLIRAETGSDYHERKRLVRAALGENTDG